MKTGDLHVAWLRAQIVGDEAAMRQFMDQLRAPGDMEPIAPLVYAAFVIAVRKAFGTEFSRGQVIRLVAAVRVTLSKLPDAVDPVAAETEIRRALGQNIPVLPDPNANSVAQLTVLDYLVRDLGLGDEGLSDLLAQARIATDLFRQRAADAGSQTGSASRPRGRCVTG